MTPPVYRFAPSPNGRLHLGHALSAILGFEAARRAGGRFLLRIEDIDLARSNRAFEDGIREDLAWLGLAWEEPMRRQSDHIDDYAAAIARLAAAGLVRETWASRREIGAAARAAALAGVPWPSDPDGAPCVPEEGAFLSAGVAASRREAGERPVLRLRTAAAVSALGRPLGWQEDGEGPAGESGLVPASPGIWGDVVLSRRDAPASYHLAVVVDDALQGVTNVLRGRDLFHATAIHRLLQELLGLPEPRYHHHRLVTDAGGRKLSKSDGDTSLAELRARGATPADIRRMIGLEASPPAA